jgi:DNA-directed RNA polymerase II subunit RPB3
MNPTISKISEEDDLYKFTLSNINVSLANALRRTILSDIPTVVFDAENSEHCQIEKNTGRLHNEILKHRLSCIPIHMNELDVLPNNYIMELNISNDTDNMIYITTENFKIKNKENNNYLKEKEIRQIFPSSIKTNMYIDFARLRPKIGSTIPGEEIKLTCEFLIKTAKDNSTFNVVSKCSYGNTIDPEKAKTVWDGIEQNMRAESSTEEIKFQKKNYYLLDAQRSFIPDSFDFIIQTVGVYENKVIIKKACVVLQNKLVELVQNIESDIVPITISESTVDNCYDIILENEDYTIGKALEYILYEKYYNGDKILTYCGFKKFHPHNDDSTLRVAFVKPTEKRIVGEYVIQAAKDVRNIFIQVNNLF